jgi:hypothetical protein
LHCLALIKWGFRFRCRLTAVGGGAGLHRVPHASLHLRPPLLCWRNAAPGQLTPLSLLLRTRFETVGCVILVISMQNYNATLCLGRVAEEADAALLFSNDDLLSLCARRAAPLTGSVARPADAAAAKANESPFPPRCPCTARKSPAIRMLRPIRPSAPRSAVL